mmetsp:Transcript_20167/g.71321  ORF Transcript_20167/g.71321 Transcript_20167/m.71321 type:complete len:335 (+) Transcript_20167:766-1770(+)
MAGRWPTPADTSTNPRPRSAFGREMPSAWSMTPFEVAVTDVDVATVTGLSTPRTGSMCTKASTVASGAATTDTLNVRPASPMAVVAATKLKRTSRGSFGLTDTVCVDGSPALSTSDATAESMLTFTITLVAPSTPNTLTTTPARKRSPMRATRGSEGCSVIWRRTTRSVSAVPKWDVVPSPVRWLPLSTEAAKARMTKVPTLSGSSRSDDTRPLESVRSVATNIGRIENSVRVRSTAGAATSEPPLSLPPLSASRAKSPPAVGAKSPAAPSASISAPPPPAPSSALSASSSSSFVMSTSTGKRVSAVLMVLKKSESDRSRRLQLVGSSGQPHES